MVQEMDRDALVQTPSGGMQEYRASKLGSQRRGGQLGACFHWQPLVVFGFFSKCRITYPQTNKQHQNTKQQNLARV